LQQRLKNPEERENAPPRNMWMAFQEKEKEFDRAEKLRQQEAISLNDPKNQKNAEWKILKELQQAERLDFISQGKSEFSQLRNSIYREVREEFKDRWADFYAAQKDGGDPEKLATLKKELVAEQKTVLDAKRDEACKELRASRDEHYRELLDHQGAIRAGLRERQEAGLENALFLQHAESAGKDLSSGFREAATETATPQDRRPDSLGKTSGFDEDGSNWNSRADDREVNFTPSVGASAVSLLDSLFFDLTTLGSAPAHSPPREPGGPDAFEASAISARKQQDEREREEADAERQRQRTL
jgi:hypothetical protein